MMLSSLFAASVFVLQTPQANSHIVIDSEFDDWAVIQPILIDPADAPQSPVDFGEVRICHDDRFVNLEADFGRNVNVQGLDGTGLILLDVDGDPKTGARQYDIDGVDIIIELSPQNLKLRKREGIAIKSTTYQPDANNPASKPLNIYDIGLMQAPTYAARRFEFRIDRGAKLPNTPSLFGSRHFTGKLVFLDMNGGVADQTDAFTYRLTTAVQSSHEDAARDPLARADGTEFRVVSWNVQRGAMLSNPDPFARTLRALGPDVLLLAELTDRNSAEQVRVLLNKSLNDDKHASWNVVLGAGGGDLRCAVATRSPLVECPALAKVSMLNHPDRTIRVAGAIAELRDRKILLVAVHLKCCGRAGGPEDQQRITEIDAIRSAIKAARAARKVDGLIIAGDINLVGSRDPLEMLAYELDLDGSVLAVPQTLQLDGLSNATWADRLQPFAPGRLDYLAYSDSTLTALRGLSFDTSDLSKQWLQAHQLQSEDTASASDHLPIVVDLRWVADK